MSCSQAAQPRGPLHWLSRPSSGQSFGGKQALVIASCWTPGRKLQRAAARCCRTLDDVNDALANTWLGRKWDSLPARYKIVFATSLAFVICNMVSFLGKYSTSASIVWELVWF